MSGAAVPDQIPNGFGAEHTIHDTNELPHGTVAVLFSVGTKGVIKMEDQEGTAISPHFEVGTYYFKFADLKLIYSTGTVAVLVPATKVYPLVVKAIA